MNIFRARPMSIAALVDALRDLPEGTSVERIERDDNEMVISVGMNSDCIEADPVIDIRLRLPKLQRFRKTGGLS